MSDGGGLALWETSNRKRLRGLENSERPYALVAISPEARWVAAVRQDSNEQIDLWRADNGRHMGVIRAAGGAKQRLTFQAGNELHVLAADGHERIFSVPTGVALSGPESEGGDDDDTRAQKSGDGGGAKAARPAAPSITRTPFAVERDAPPSAPAARE